MHKQRQNYIILPQTNTTLLSLPFPLSFFIQQQQGSFQTSASGPPKRSSSSSFVSQSAARRTKPNKQERNPTPSRDSRPSNQYLHRIAFIYTKGGDHLFPISDAIFLCAPLSQITKFYRQKKKRILLLFHRIQFIPLRNTLPLLVLTFHPLLFLLLQPSFLVPS